MKSDTPDVPNPTGVYPDPFARLPGPGGCCVRTAHLPGRGCPPPEPLYATAAGLSELTEPGQASAAYPNTVSDTAAALARERQADEDRPRGV